MKWLGGGRLIAIEKSQVHSRPERLHQVIIHTHMPVSPIQDSVVSSRLNTMRLAQQIFAGAMPLPYNAPWLYTHARWLAQIFIHAIGGYAKITGGIMMHHEVNSLFGTSWPQTKVLAPHMWSTLIVLYVDKTINITNLFRCLSPKHPMCLLFWLMWMNSCTFEHSTFTSWSGNTFKTRWQVLLRLLLQFIRECNSERIIKIGQSFPKLAQKVCLGVFFTHGV